MATASRGVGRRTQKGFGIMTGQMQYRAAKKLSADGTLANTIFSLRLCVVCVTGPDTIIASEDYLGVRKKGNPPCNAEDNLRTGLLIIEARFRGY